MSNVKAVILAAGRGSRLKNLTDEKPKAMVELKSRPLIDYQISALHDNNINDIAVVVGYQKEKIIHDGITQFFENQHWQDSNMVSSLFEADSWLSHDEVIVSYSDIFYKNDVVASLKSSHAPLAITYDVNFLELWENRFESPLDDLESFRLDGDSNLIEIGKNPNDMNDIEGQYMGLLKFTPPSWQETKAILERSNAQIASCDMTSMLNILIHHGVRIKAVPINSQWGEIDHISDLQLYENSDW